MTESNGELDGSKREYELIRDALVDGISKEVDRLGRKIDSFRDEMRAQNNRLIDEVRYNTYFIPFPEPRRYYGHLSEYHEDDEGDF